MVRGQMLAGRLVDQELIATGRRLLVVRAGAGGLTTAIEAARRGCPVTVIKVAGWPFDRQRQSNNQ